VKIRDATPDDADAACDVLRRSISKLCVADHGNDPAILNAWLGNKQEARAAERGNARCTLTSTETAHRFYRSAGYIDDGAPRGNFGTASAYPVVR
jgi:hypothetical protein